MKKKDIVYLVVALLIFVVAGILGLQALAPKSAASNEVKVEVVAPIESQFDGEALKQLSDPEQVQDFSVPIDLTTGLDNAAPFNTDF